jgi:ABC-2 type transport system permease protein
MIAEEPPPGMLLDRLRSLALMLGAAGGLLGIAIGLTVSQTEVTGAAALTIPAGSIWAFGAVVTAGLVLVVPTLAMALFVVTAAGLVTSFDWNVLTGVAGALLLAAAGASFLASTPATAPRAWRAFKAVASSQNVTLSLGAIGALLAIVGGFGPYLEDDTGSLPLLLTLPLVALVGAVLAVPNAVGGAIILFAAAIAIGATFDLNAITITALVLLVAASATGLYGFALQKPSVRMGSPLVPSVILIMWRRELLRFMRDRSQLFGAFSRTVLWLLILGYGLGVALREVEGYPYSNYVLPGVVVLNVLYASLQSAIALVWDKNVGLLREVLVSPAPTLSVTLGKLFGGASVATIQGTVPLLFMPLIGMSVSIPQIIMAWGVMFVMGTLATSIGVIIASRMRTFEGFGAISNGVIQPLYFLSGSIFPLRGVIGGTGFSQIPNDLRIALQRAGVHFASGSWFVQLPLWLQILVYANPVSYNLDLLRYILLDFQQLPLTADFLVTFLLPFVAIVWAAYAMRRMLRPR